MPKSNRTTRVKTAAKTTTKAESTPASSDTTEKFPQLRTAFDAMKAERENIRAALAPQTAQRDKLRDELAQREAELRAMNKALLESPQNQRLFELDNQIGALARTMGAKSMRQAEG